jgi:hypothetical protein
MLERDTTRRLGCKPNGEGFEELKKQAWFKNFDWDRLEDKELEPPFVPDVRIVSVYADIRRLALLVSNYLLRILLYCLQPETNHLHYECRVNGPTLTPLTNWRSCYWRITR